MKYKYCLYSELYMMLPCAATMTACAAFGLCSRVSLNAVPFQYAYNASLFGCAIGTLASQTLKVFV